jgi:CPA2 family monovalent cation:H+ antiporter-2
LDEVTILLNMTLLLLVAGGCSVIFKKLKMPAIIGYLIAGILLANLPFLFDIISGGTFVTNLWEGWWVKDDGIQSDSEIITDILATMGLVLLMFVIGMELNLKKLKRIGKFATIVALIQLPLMVLGGFVFGIMMGWDPVVSILFGALISGSSTAVVTIVAKSQGKLSKEDVETVVLITVVEDVAQVVMLSMAAPLLGATQVGFDSVIWVILIITIFMLAAVSIGIIVIPRALDWIAARMPDEILLVTAIGLCFGMALLSVWVGMSMAIGAFLMGVVVSQAKCSSTIEHDITPMKDIFMAMFFISVGLMIAVQDILNNIILIILIFLIYAALKMSTVILAYFVGNRSLRISFMSAVSLVVMGEFAFIISKAALDAGVMDSSIYASVICAALISMITIPIMTHNSGKICDVVYEHSPKPLINAVAKAESIRDRHYAKIALTSKSTSSKFKDRAVMAYVDVLAIILIEIVFFLFTSDMTDFLHTHMERLEHAYCYTIVLGVNFVAISVPLYDLIKNLKFVEKVYIDAERRAEARGEGDLQRRAIRLQKAFVRINNWLLVFGIAFAILVIKALIVPSDVGFTEHILAMLGGIGVILLIYAYRRKTEAD